MPKPPGYPVPHHRVADGFADYEPGSNAGMVGRINTRQIGVSDGVHDQPLPTCLGTPSYDQPEILTPPQPRGPRQHGASSPPSGSGGQLLAALAAASGEDGAARSSAHPQAEPVRPGASTVVRLEGALTLGHG